jgi:hypothetical protein
MTTAITSKAEKFKAAKEQYHTDLFIPKRVLICDDNPSVIKLLEAEGRMYTRNVNTNYGMQYIKEYENTGFPEDNSTVLFVPLKNKEDARNLQISISSIGRWWQVNKLNKKRYAYGQEAPGFLKLKDVASAIAENIGITNKECLLAGNIIDILENPQFAVNTAKLKPIKYTHSKPLRIVLGAELFDRRNGGEFTIDIQQGEEVLASGYHEVINTTFNMSRTYCGTTIPFSLASMMIAIFGSDLQFNDKTPYIADYLKGKIKIDIMNDEYASGCLRQELTRWLSDPSMTFNKFITHCVMFMIPVTVRSSR